MLFQKKGRYALFDVPLLILSPEKARARQPLLICPLVWGPPIMQGLRSTSAYLWVPEKAGVRQLLLISSPCLGTPENARVT